MADIIVRRALLLAGALTLFVLIAPAAAAEDDPQEYFKTNCYGCHERCPQEVKPVEVIISLKNMLADRGLAPPAADKVIQTFMVSGRTVPDNPAIDKQRAKFDLPPLKPVPMDEILALIGPEAEEERGS